MSQHASAEASESAEVAETKYPEGIPPSLSDIPPESTVMSSASATTSGSTGWETILLPFNAFVRTNYGFVMEPQTSLLRQRVKSIGIGLTDRVEGPFDLRIHRMWATNGIGEQEAEEDRLICGANALPVDEGVRSGWTDKGKEEQQQERSKAKGLKGLRSEWDQ